MFRSLLFQILSLYERVQGTSDEVERTEHDLELVEQQQQELAAILDQLEKQAGLQPNARGRPPPPTHADMQREHLCVLLLLCLLYFRQLVD